MESAIRNLRSLAIRGAGSGKRTFVAINFLISADSRSAVGFAVSLLPPGEAIERDIEQANDRVADFAWELDIQQATSDFD